MKRTTMELGGHAPVLVFDDVDVDAVLDLAVTSKFRNAGQVCVSPTRFYVQEAIYERFAAGFAARAKQVKVGNGLDEGVRMGPLAHARRLPAVASLIDEAVKDGATRAGWCTALSRARASSTRRRCSPTCRKPRAS